MSASSILWHPFHGDHNNVLEKAKINLSGLNFLFLIEIPHDSVYNLIIGTHGSPDYNRIIVFKPNSLYFWCLDLARILLYLFMIPIFPDLHRALISKLNIGPLLSIKRAIILKVFLIFLNI